MKNRQIYTDKKQVSGLVVAKDWGEEEWGVTA